MEEINITPTQPFTSTITNTHAFHEAFDILTSIVSGTNTNADNWILILTRAMTITNNITGLTRDQKIDFAVELVVRYLDDYTTLDDIILLNVKASIKSTCVSMLNNTGVIHTTHTTHTSSTDPDMLVTPLQITELLTTKIVNLITSRKMNITDFKIAFPEIIILAIVTVEKYKHLTSMEKKNLVLATIKKLITDYLPKQFSLNNDELTGLLLLVDSMPLIIDTMVGVVKGKPSFSFKFDDPETINKFILLLNCLVSCWRRPRV